MTLPTASSDTAPAPAPAAGRRPRTRRPTVRLWWLAALAGVAAAVARALLQPVLGNEMPFVVAFPAVALAALLWGIGPALLTAALCAFAVALPFFPPYADPQDRPLQVGLFMLSAIVICLVSGQLGNARRSRPPSPAQAVVHTPLTAWLRTVLLGALLIPVTVFLVVAWWGLEVARTDAEAVAARASKLAADHAKAVFDVAAQVARRTGEVTAGSETALAADEAAIRQRLADIAVGLPAVVNLNVWDAEGRPLARSDTPPDRSAVVRDRPYFVEQRDHADILAHSGGFGISEVMTGRQTGKELMNLIMRRPSADGSFRGVVGVSMAPAFFRDYYQALSAENRRLANFTLVRNDGVILARWPLVPDVRTRMPPHSETLHRILAGDAEGILVRSPEPGRETRVVSFRKVPGYPVYVIAAFSRSAMLADWLRFLAVLAAVLAPVTVGLVYVTWVALRKTRQENATAAALRDEIRRRSAAERSRLESQRLETLSLLTGGVAHDFNNLLAIVNTSLHLHLRKHPGQAAEPQVKAMSRAIQSGVRLTRQLLSFSRKQALHPETVELQTWLPAAAELLRTTLGAGIVLRHEVAPDTGAILVDTAELELALINLAVNARHALPDGGSLAVVACNAPADAGPDLVLIRVQDDGMGIPADVLPRVLEPFFTTRERGTGSGLGLSQVHGLVTQSGGRMHISSQPGEGTAVSLFFPRIEAASVLAEPAEAAMDRLSGSLLLVEDNEDLAGTMADMLAAAGLQVQRAASAREALDRLAAAETLPGAVLSDIAMPGGMDGIQLAFVLRERYPGLPVLLATGYADKLDVATSGGLEVLAKPLSPQHLLRRLRELIPQD